MVVLNFFYSVVGVVSVGAAVGECSVADGVMAAGRAERDGGVQIGMLSLDSKVSRRQLRSLVIFCAACLIFLASVCSRAWYCCCICGRSFSWICSLIILS